MACTSESTYPGVLVPGQFTAFKFSHLPAPTGDCTGSWITGFSLISTVDVPPFTDVTYEVRIGAHIFRADVVSNGTPNPTSAAISGSVSISADGKAFNFNDSVGNPQSVSIDGFWSDGITLVASASANPPGPPAPTELTINQHFFSFVVTPDTDFDGTDPPDDPTALELEETVDPDDADRLQITASWTNPPGNDELGFFVERSLDGNIWEIRGFTTAGITEFVDGEVVDDTYFYRVRAFKGDGNPANSGYSNYTAEESIDFQQPDIIIIGSGQVDIGGSSPLQLIGEPSGIYTLVKDKTHDTLYERQAGTTTSVNVKIPDPYIKTAFIGSGDE